jgi:predicted NBD/HSP70 family sugar kinase
MMTCDLAASEPGRSHAASSVHGTGSSRLGSASRAVLQPGKMRRINRRVLLNRLQALGTASRADLAKALGLSQPTAGKIVDELLASGVLEEVAAPEATTQHGTHARPGRPGRRLRLDQRRPRFVAIQLGVRHTRFAPVAVGGNREDVWAVEALTPTSAQAWVGELRRAAAKLKSRDCWGVLVSVPGIVDEAGGRVLYSPNLHWTEKAGLVELIQEAWKVPVLLVQEERALALGHHAAVPTLDDFLLVDFGEGVGGAVIVDGRPHANPLPVSGELGHTPVLGNRRACGCGSTGCLETLASQQGLLASFEKAQRARTCTWEALVAHIAQQGVAPWLADALDATGAIIAGAVNVLGLRHVVVTGCLTEFPGTVVEHLTAAIRRGALWGRFGEIVVQTAPRRRIAGLVAMGLDRLVLPLTGGGHLERSTGRQNPNRTLTHDAIAIPVNG